MVPPLGESFWATCSASCWYVAGQPVKWLSTITAVSQDLHLLLKQKIKFKVCGFVNGLKFSWISYFTPASHTIFALCQLEKNISFDGIYLRSCSVYYDLSNLIASKSIGTCSLTITYVSDMFVRLRPSYRCTINMFAELEMTCLLSCKYFSSWFLLRWSGDVIFTGLWSHIWTITASTCITGRFMQILLRADIYSLFYLVRYSETLGKLLVLHLKFVALCFAPQLLCRQHCKGVQGQRKLGMVANLTQWILLSMVEMPARTPGTLYLLIWLTCLHAASTQNAFIASELFLINYVVRNFLII